MSKTGATLVGLCAILLWSTLALLTASSGKVPPFQLTAICFSIAGSLGLISWMFRPGNIKVLKQPLAVWLLGVGGLFGYHFFYFTALRNAPAVEAGLIAYLWPLLIVLFSTLLPGETARAHHLLGAVIGLGGAGLIVTGGKSITVQPEFLFGYAAALVCALIWSGYSVLSRLFENVPSDIVTGFCLAAALLSLLCHLLLETTVWPHTTLEWAAVVALGLGPVGCAFFVWDYGLKHGHIQILGALAYLAPLLSTLILIAAGHGEFTWSVLLACIMITAGALIASRDLLLNRAMDP